MREITKSYLGFTDGKKPIQKARIEKTLDVLIKYKDEVYDRKNFISMKLKNVNFETLESVRRRCITFAKDGNTIVKPYKTLYNVEQITGNNEHKTLYFEIKKSKGTWEEVDYYLFEDLGTICSKVSWIPSYWTLERFTEEIGKWKYFGKDGLIKRLKDLEENGRYINLLDIELCIILEEVKLAEHYAEYRENWRKEREVAKEKERAEREAKEREEKEKRLAEVQKILFDAEYKIFKQEELYNEEIEETTIINALMKKYKIKVPLRTQGWINSKLAMIVFKAGKISYKYYGKSRKDNSTVFQKYLEELENAVNEALAIPLF